MGDTMTVSGVWAWMKKHPGFIGRRRVTELAKQASQQAFTEFVHNRSLQGIGLRFSPRAYDILGLTPRSPKYEARKKKFFGKDLPYVSPTRTYHMRDILGVRGPGHSFSHGGVGEIGSVSTTLKLPGARNLNRVKGIHAADYRREFLQLRERAKEQGDRIAKRAVELFAAALIAEMESHARITVSLDTFGGDN